MLTQLKIKKQTTFNIVIIKGSLQVGVTGFEPATTWSQTRCATGLRYAPNSTAKINIIPESPKRRIKLSSHIQSEQAQTWQLAGGKICRRARV